MTLLVLATGGTIASRLDEHGAVVPAVAPADLLAAVPGLDALGPLEVEEVARVNGWNIDPATMVRVAERARAALLGGGVDGVVVTHGTDTVEETLYLTDLLAGEATDRGAIAFACAMRSGSDVAADGPRNLLHAAVVAAAPAARGRGALLCVNDEIHAARWVTKTDTTNVSTFRSPPAGPVGAIERGRPRFFLDTPARPPRGGDVDLDVALLKAYSGMGDRLLRHLVDGDVSGVVIEGTGAGNVPGALVPAIERAIGSGVPVVIASRCWTGRTVPIYGGPGGGVTLDGLGVIRSNGLNGPKARLALMVALGVTRDLDGLRAWFADA
ncbi:MAG: asparaginase [Euzebyaceae bacterium]|nr:asparaginase [Euzebyaceae bacterium]